LEEDDSKIPSLEADKIVEEDGFSTLCLVKIYGTQYIGNSEH